MAGREEESSGSKTEPAPEDDGSDVQVALSRLQDFFTTAKASALLDKDVFHSKKWRPRGEAPLGPVAVDAPEQEPAASTGSTEPPPRPVDGGGVSLESVPESDEADEGVGVQGVPTASLGKHGNRLPASQTTCRSQPLTMYGKSGELIDFVGAIDQHLRKPEKVSDSIASTLDTGSDSRDPEGESLSPEKPGRSLDWIGSTPDAGPSSMHLDRDISLNVPRTPGATPRQETTGGSLRHLQIGHTHREEFQQFAKVMKEKLRIECANKNPYVQALSVHRLEMQEGCTLTSEVDSLPSMLATQRSGGLARLEVRQAAAAKVDDIGLFGWVMCQAPRCSTSDVTCRTRAYDFVLSPRNDFEEQASNSSTTVPASSRSGGGTPGGRWYTQEPGG